MSDLDGSPGGTDGGAQCGHRGLACCAGACDPRSSCDGTTCIASDVWASGVDGIADFNGGSWVQPLLSGSTNHVPGVNALWGTTSTFVVGVGAAGLILRYDGTAWHRDVAPRADGTGTLFAVSAAARPTSGRSATVTSRTTMAPPGPTSPHPPPTAFRTRRSG